MTQPTAAPAQPPAQDSLDLPENFPMVVHVVSAPMFPPEPEVDASGQPTGRLKPEEPVHWLVSQAHPFVPKFHVLRMFRGADGVAVYSVSDDEKLGMRDVVPAHNVRLVQETMPMDVFLDELEDAEYGDDGEPEPDPDPEPEPAPQQDPTPAASQPS